MNSFLRSALAATALVLTVAVPALVGNANAGDKDGIVTSQEPLLGRRDRSRIKQGRRQEGNFLLRRHRSGAARQCRRQPRPAVPAGHVRQPGARDHIHHRQSRPPAWIGRSGCCLPGRGGFGVCRLHRFRLDRPQARIEIETSNSRWRRKSSSRSRLTIQK